MTFCFWSSAVGRIELSHSFFSVRSFYSHIFLAGLACCVSLFSGVSENSLGDRHGSSAGRRRGASLPSVSSAIFLDDLALLCRSEKSTHQQQFVFFNVCCMHQLSGIMLNKTWSQRRRACLSFSVVVFVLDCNTMPICRVLAHRSIFICQTRYNN